MFIGVLSKVWCQGRAPPQPPPSVFERYVTGRVGEQPYPYKLRSGIAAPSVSERYVTGRVRAPMNPYKPRSGIKKKNPPYAGR